jgi:myosin-crossreactive antigen
MQTDPKAWLIGSGIGSLAAASFMIRDVGMPVVNFDAVVKAFA